MNDVEIIEAAIRVYGAREQEDMAVEECAELIQAINHKHRGRSHNIAEEIADVEICLEQLKIINECTDDVVKIKMEKIERLYDNICDECF